jgi:hypothetical protein
MTWPRRSGCCRSAARRWCERWGEGEGDRGRGEGFREGERQKQTDRGRDRERESQAPLDARHLGPWRAVVAGGEPRAAGCRGDRGHGGAGGPRQDYTAAARAARDRISVLELPGTGHFEMVTTAPPPALPPVLALAIARSHPPHTTAPSTAFRMIWRGAVMAWAQITPGDPCGPRWPEQRAMAMALLASPAVAAGSKLACAVRYFCVLGTTRVYNIQYTQIHIRLVKTISENKFLSPAAARTRAHIAM